MPKFDGPGKCRYHHCDLVWCLKEWFCPKCESDPNRTPKSKGMDGPDGFTIIDLDIDYDWKKGGGSGI